MQIQFLKKCRTCHQTKLICEFYKNKSYKDKHTADCKDCLREYHQRPDVLSKHAEVERNRRKRMGDEYRKKDRARNIKRRDKILEYNHKHYAENIDEIKRKQKEWRDAHPGWSDEAKRRRRTRAMGLPATLTESEWQSILEKWNYSCSYCGRDDVKLFRDHAIPVTRGGGYTAENIRPACGSCNSRKHTMTADEFIAKIRK